MPDDDMNKVGSTPAAIMEENTEDNEDKIKTNVDDEKIKRSEHMAA